MPAFIALCGYYITPAVGRSRSLPPVARLGARLGYNARVAAFLRILYHTCGQQIADPFFQIGSGIRCFLL